MATGVNCIVGRVTYIVQRCELVAMPASVRPSLPFCTSGAYWDGIASQTIACIMPAIAMATALWLKAF